MKPIALVFFCWLSLTPVYPAFDYLSFSARHAALANSLVASIRAGDGFVNNPALAINTTTFYGALNYSQFFGLKELRYATGVVSFPVKSLGIGASIEDFGSSLYREDKLSIALSRLLQKGKLALGISFHVYHISVQNYENMTTWGVSVGVRYEVKPNLYAAGVVDNINQPRINGFSEEIPQQISFGLFYKVSDAMAAHFAVQKDSWFAPGLSVGIEYQVFSNLKLYSGYSTLAAIPSIGIELHSSSLEVGYTVQYHFELGTTHFIGIAYAP